MTEPREIDVRLPTHTTRVLMWGADDAPLALALHGFPDTAWTWRHLGPHLAERGWRVVAPFTRGYAPSTLPPDGVYTVAARMADAVALHTALDGDARAVLIGHDWGSFTASGLGAHPDAPFARVVLLAVPPTTALNPGSPWTSWAGAMLRQPARSWYMALNQVPGLSERNLAWLVPLLWRTWSPGFDAADDVARVLASTPDLAHARAVVSYYRQLLRRGGGAPAYAEWHRTWNRTPRVPMLYLHGARDGCLDPRWFDLVQARRLEGGFAEGSQTALVPGAGHFLQLERPDLVNPLVSGFLAG